MFAKKIDQNKLQIGKKPALRAFTLSEVLITLGIIGVIAAMTIPSLIQKQQEQQTVVALKKAYSTLSGAYTYAVQENGTPENWNLIGANSGAGAINMLNVLEPYLRLTKKCGTGTGCFPNKYLHVNGTGLSNTFDSLNFIAKGQLADGSLIFTQVKDKDCSSPTFSSVNLQSICGMVVFDINGAKNPNKAGVDLFYFYITKNGIIPQGTALDDGADSFENMCKDISLATTKGWGCTAWVLYNENMDYLHCSYLSWTGKHKCD